MIQSNLFDVLQNINFEDVQSSPDCFEQLSIYEEGEEDSFNSLNDYIQAKVTGIEQFTNQLVEGKSINSILSSLYIHEDRSREIVKEADWFTDSDYDKYLHPFIRKKIIVRLNSQELTDYSDFLYFTNIFPEKSIFSSLLTLPFYLPEGFLSGWILVSIGDLLLINSSTTLYFLCKNNNTKNHYKKYVEKIREQRIVFIS